MTWTLHLSIDLPSANRHGGAATNARHAANAAQYRRQRGLWVSMLKAEARFVGVSTVIDRPLPLAGLDIPPRAVTITRLWAKGCRAWDDDNMVAACKGLRDAMQRERVSVRKGKVPKLIGGAGIVWDDSAKWSAWSYAQERSPDGRPGVRVTIVDGAAP